MSIPNNDDDEAPPERADGELQDDDGEMAEASAAGRYSPSDPLLARLRQQLRLQNSSQQDHPRQRPDPESAESIAAWKEDILELTRTRTSEMIHHPEPDQSIHNPPIVRRPTLRSTAQANEHPSPSCVLDCSVQGRNTHASEVTGGCIDGVQQQHTSQANNEHLPDGDSESSARASTRTNLVGGSSPSSILIPSAEEKVAYIADAEWYLQVTAADAETNWDQEQRSPPPPLPPPSNVEHPPGSNITVTGISPEGDSSIVAAAAVSLRASAQEEASPFINRRRNPPHESLAALNEGDVSEDGAGVDTSSSENRISNRKRRHFRNFRRTSHPDRVTHAAFAIRGLDGHSDSSEESDDSVQSDQQAETAIEHRTPGSSFIPQEYPGAAPLAETAPVIIVQPLDVLPQATVVTLDDQQNKLRDLRLIIYDEDLIEEHNQKFVEGTREWFVRRFDAWVAETTSSSRVFCLAANAGIGKTTMMSWLGLKEDATFSFLSALPKVPEFRAHVLEHMETYNLTRARLLESDEFNVASIFQQFLKMPLKASSQQVGDKTHVFVIDALDEITSDGGRKNDLLACIEKHFDKLPPWIKVCIATRPEAPIITLSRQGDVMSIGGPLKKFHPLVLEPTAKENMTDVRIYLKVQLERLFRELISHSNVSVNILEAVDILTRKSEGYFIYSEYVVLRLRELLLKQTSELSLAVLEAFPDDMEAFYREQLGRLLPKDADNLFCRIVWQTLRLVTVAKEPLHIDLLRKWIGCSHTELHAAMETLSKLLPVRSGRVETYHKSFVDWLVKPTRKGDAYHIDLQEARNEMAQICLAELDKFGTTLASSATCWSRSREDRENRGDEHYVLKYSLKHFLGCSPQEKALLRDMARSLLLNIDIMHCRVAIGDLFGHSQDCHAFAQFSNDRVIFLIGRALELSLGVVAKDYRQLQGQLIGRLLGSAKSTFTSTKIGEELKQLMSAWKLKHYGFSWWCPLVPSWDQADSSCLKVLLHPSGVTSVAWSPDGKQIASGSFDKSVRIWEVETGQCQRVLEGHGLIESVAWSPDGKQVALGSFDKSVRIWVVETGQCQKVLEGHTDCISSVAWSPDGKQAASGSVDRSVRIWVVETGQCQRVLEGHTSNIGAVVWSPDGEQVASCSHDKSVRIWVVETGQCQRALVGHAGRIDSVAWSPDGKQIASGSRDKSVRMWEVETGQCQRILVGHAGRVNSVAWSPDGKQIVSGSVDTLVRIWDVETGQCQRVLEGHTGFIDSVAWSPLGKQVASGSTDKSVRIWDVETGQYQRDVEGHTDFIKSVAWSPDGKQAASGSVDKSVRIWEVETGHCHRVLKGHTDVIESVAWSPDGKQVASVSHDKSVRIWKVETGQCQRVLEGHTDVILSVAWCPDGKQVASGSSDESVRIWDVETGQCQRVLEGHTRWIESVAWSPDGKQVASGSYDKSVRIWDVETGQCQRVLEGHTRMIRAVVWSPRGKQVASGSHDMSVRIWEVESGQCQRVLEGHTRWIDSVAWSTNGKQVASKSETSIRIWNVSSGACLLELRADSGFPPAGFQKGFGTKSSFSDIANTAVASVNCDQLMIMRGWACGQCGTHDLLFFELMTKCSVL